jgi:hypothetical protein
MSNLDISIGWCITSESFAIAFDPPSKLIPPKDVTANSKGFLSCPAVRKFSEGIYQVFSPFSLKLRVVENNGQLAIVPVYPFTSLNEEVARIFIKIEPQESWNTKTTAVIQIPSPYVFISDHKILIEQFSPELSKKSKMNWRVIPGKFDIYAWQRPLNWAFEWDLSCGDFEIRAGEPQYNIRFIPQEQPIEKCKITLEKLELNKSILERLALTRDVAKIKRGTSQLFSKAAQLRENKTFLKKNEDS